MVCKSLQGCDPIKMSFNCRDTMHCVSTIKNVQPTKSYVPFSMSYISPISYVLFPKSLVSALIQTHSQYPNST